MFVRKLLEKKIVRSIFQAFLLVTFFTLLLGYILTQVHWEYNPAVFLPNFQTEQNLEHKLLQQQFDFNSNLGQAAEPLMLKVQLASSAKQDLISLREEMMLQLELVSGIKSILNKDVLFDLASQVEQPLFNHRYLLNDFNQESWQEYLQELWASWQLVLGDEKKLLLLDPNYSWLTYLQKSSSIFNQLASSNSAKQQEELFFLLELSDDIDFSKLATQLNNFAQQNQIEISWSSGSYVAWYTEQTIRNQIFWLTILSTCLVIVFLFWRFRKLSQVGLVFFPLLFSSLIGLVVANLFFGGVNVLAFAVAMVLLGVLVDYPVHFITLKNNPKTWRSLRLAVLTTLGGYLILYGVASEGIKQVAVLASTGLIVTLLLTWLFLRGGTLQVDADASSELTSIKTNLVIVNMSRGILVSLGIFSFVVLLKPIIWQDDLVAISPVSQEMLQVDGQLRREFNRPELGYGLYVVDSSVENLLLRLEGLSLDLDSLVRDGVISSSLDLSDWLPSKFLQEQRQAKLPKRSDLIRELEGGSLPFKAQHFAEFFETLELSKSADFIDLEAFKKLSLPWQQELVSLLIQENQKEVIGRIWLADIQNHQKLRELAQKNDVIYLEQRQVITQMIADLREQLIWIIISIVLIFLFLLYFQLKSIAEAVIIWIPVVIASSFTMALLSVFWSPLSLFHLIALVLVLAIGIDYSVFARRVAKGQMTMRSINTVVATSLMTLGLLWFTSIPLLINIGQTLVVGVISMYLVARAFHRI